MKKHILFSNRNWKHELRLESEKQNELRQEAIDVETSRAVAAEDELLLRLQGKSKNSDSRSDPFKHLGNFANYNEFNAAIDALTYSGTKGKGFGYFRAQVDSRDIEIKNILLSDSSNVIGQMVQGMLTLYGKKLQATNNYYRVYFRKHQNGAWGDWAIVSSSESGGTGSNSGVGDGTIDTTYYVTKEEFDDVVEGTDIRLSQLETDVTDLSDVARTGAYDDLIDPPTFKTINGESILGSGDLEIIGGGASLTNYITKDTFYSSLGQIESAYGRTVRKIIINGSEKNPVNGTVDLGTIIGDGSVDLSEYATKEEFDVLAESADERLSQLEQNVTDLSDVARTGAYDDLIDPPNVVTKVKINGVAKTPVNGTVDLGTIIGDGSVDFSEYATKEEFDALAESADERLSQLEQNVTDLSDVARTGTYDDLIDPPTFKTINGESILGSGDIEITGGSSDFSNYITKDTFYSSLGQIEAAYGRTVRKIVINGSEKTPVSGTVDLGTIIGDGNIDLSEYTTKEDFDALAESAEERLYQLEQNVTDLSDVARTGTYDDLIDPPTFKTINGESIIGAGNIAIAGVGVGAYGIVEHGTAQTTFVLTPNTFHVWGTVSSLTLTLGSETSGVANEYLFQFTSPNANSTTLALPDTIKWADGSLNIEKGKTYQVSILKNCATILSFE